MQKRVIIVIRSLKNRYQFVFFSMMDLTSVFTKTAVISVYAESNMHLINIANYTICSELSI